jgi:transcriptional regulator with XRE-family HTH domain
MTKLLPRDCLRILGDEFDLHSQAQVARFLHVTQGRVSQINSSKNLTKIHIKRFLGNAFRAGKHEAQADANTKLLNSFGKLRNLHTQAKQAAALGKTQGAIAQWKSGHLQVSGRTIESILKKAANLTVRHLVEMEEVDPGQPGASHWYFYSTKTNHRRKILLRKLRHKRGIYFYFDATGRLTYVGKADRTALDKEAENRLSHEIKSGRIPYGKKMRKNPKLRQVRSLSIFRPTRLPREKRFLF